MSISIVSLQHVNLRVPPDVEDATKNFYGNVLGLPEMPKPEDAQARGGAWYQLGEVQLHLSRDPRADNATSKRHICFHVADLEETRQPVSYTHLTLPTSDLV